MAVVICPTLISGVVIRPISSDLDVLPTLYEICPAAWRLKWLNLTASGFRLLDLKLTSLLAVFALLLSILACAVNLPGNDPPADATSVARSVKSTINAETVATMQARTNAHRRPARCSPHPRSRRQRDTASPTSHLGCPGHQPGSSGDPGRAHSGLSGYASAYPRSIAWNPPRSPIGKCISGSRSIQVVS